MKILITNHWLKKLGGSETFTYTLAKELQRKGHEVHFFTNVEGLVSNRLLAEGVKRSNLKSKYDLILANHHTTVDKVHHLGPTIQTCHGVIPKLEQPSENADILVAISEEVALHIKTTHIIRNGVDCQRFKPSRKLPSKPKKILSLVHSDEANILLRKLCKELNIHLLPFNKYSNPIWDIERIINQCDLVISLGRGVYEAMACGVAVVVFDKRPYQKAMADGYLSKDIIDKVIKNNCSGRFFKHEFTKEELASEIQKYNPKDGVFLRNYALEHFNIEYQAEKYLNLIL